MTKHKTMLAPKQSCEESEYTSVFVDCTTVRSGKRKIVTKTFSSKRSALPLAGDLNTIDIAFTLEKTKREILQYRLIFEPGCIITDDNGTYRCTSIAYTDPPKHPILHARYIGPLTTTA